MTCRELGVSSTLCGDEMPRAGWHPIPVPVGRLPVARERATAINTCTAGIHFKDYFCYCKIPSSVVCVLTTHSYPF